MQRKGSNQRLSSSSSSNNNNTLLRSRISSLMLTMLATIASFYVAGRLWQDAQNRVYIIHELDKITGQGRSAISVDDSLKVIACREQQKKLSALQMELAAAKEEGFVPEKHYGVDKAKPKKKPLVVVGILTSFGRKNKRDAVRKAWMGTGAALKKMENEKGIVARFVIGRSENRGDSLDLEIDIENRQHNDFIILNDHVETSKQLPKKTMFFFAHVASWEAEYYAKVNDDVYVNIDALGNTLAAHVDKPRVYMGCMKSGEVFSEPSQKWYEPEWWKFGDGKSYFRHASGEIFVISQALGKFVSINRSKLRTYAHDDVSVGSWFIGLDIKHIDERKFCCSSWASGAICAGVS